MSYRLLTFGRLKDRAANLHRIDCVWPCQQTKILITSIPIKMYYHICTYQTWNSTWKPYCDVSFNMGWQDISKFGLSLPLRIKYNIGQPVLKLTTQYGFYELFLK